MESRQLNLTVQFGGYLSTGKQRRRQAAGRCCWQARLRVGVQVVQMQRGARERRRGKRDYRGVEEGEAAAGSLKERWRSLQQLAGAVAEAQLRG